MKKGVVILFLLTFVICLYGCKKDTPEKNEPVDVEFAVVPDTELPEELHDYIENRRDEEFKMSFIDGNYMYIAICYGKMTGRGYSIHIYDVKEYDDNISINAKLASPKNNNGDTVETFPYIVIKLENKNKKVIFKD